MVKALNTQIRYRGTRQPEIGEKDARTGRPLYPYLPSTKLIEAVNIAIYLEKPLLVRGEPGCGKTRLAYAIAYELDLPLETWYIKSTTQARDGLYTYDVVGRLRDAQLASAEHITKPEDIDRISNPATYIKWGALGRAFRREQRSVILIDEIDKADMDFPNDLLLELDELRFVIEETDEEIRAAVPPIVIITSNDEQDLPDAFLRRCLFHYVEFPNSKRLASIVQNLFPSAPSILVEKAVDRFLQLRQNMQRDKGEIGKKVSTSELLDWFRVLKSYPQDDVLSDLDGKLPFAGVLLKTWDDHRRYMIETEIKRQDVLK
ncbi:MAG: MoxR family ATPase [Cyanobacteria bacterium J06634_5]